MEPRWDQGFVARHRSGRPCTWQLGGDPLGQVRLPAISCEDSSASGSPGRSWPSRFPRTEPVAAGGSLARSSPRAAGCSRAARLSRTEPVATSGSHARSTPRSTGRSRPTWLFLTDRGRTACSRTEDHRSAPRQRSASRRIESSGNQRDPDRHVRPGWRPLPGQVTNNDMNILLPSVWLARSESSYGSGRVSLFPATCRSPRPSLGVL